LDIPHKQIHNIDSDGCGASENWEKNFGPPQPESRNMTFNPKRDYHHPRYVYMSRG
jgi:hypothetical protein